MVLVDAGGANFHSVQSAFERLGVQARVSRDRGCIAEATHLVLPGVGAAAAAMQRLREARLDDFLPTTTQPLADETVDRVEVSLPQGSAAKPSSKPFRSTGMPMPSSGVWKTMKVAEAPVFSVSSSCLSRITSA